MEILFLLVPLSLLLVALIAGIFIWAVKSGQYDDLDRSGQDILLDDDRIAPDGKQTEQRQQNDQ